MAKNPKPKHNSESTVNMGKIQLKGQMMCFLLTNKWRTQKGWGLLGNKIDKTQSNRMKYVDFLGSVPKK